MKKLYLLIVTIVCCTISNAQLTYSEGFEGTFPPIGWVINNLSNPVGPSTWRKVDQSGTVDGTEPGFPAFAGSTMAFVSYGSTSTTGSSNTISNWFLSPVLKLRDGATFSFYTRTYTASPYPDRLQVRLSTNGSSVNVGATETSVGDFTTIVCDINPNLSTTAGTTCGAGYPDSWQQYTFTLSGLGTTCNNGRLAFRYFVTQGGAAGANSYAVAIDNFSYTTPAVCGQALPVSLLSFTGTTKGNTNILNWVTASETNNKEFEVLKSIDGINFSTVGSIATKGNTTNPSNYEWIDTKPFATAFYKLKQIDNDGKFQYSNVVSIKQNGKQEMGIALKQNPVKASLSFIYNLPSDGNVQISIIDVFGRIMYNGLQKNSTQGLHNVELPTSNFSNGNYFIKLSSNGTTITKQFVVQQ